VEVVAYGEEKPAAFGHSEMDWAKNRRVVLNYTAGRP
jgi:peptidoglycan-associated lipoprotein